MISQVCAYHEHNAWSGAVAPGIERKHAGKNASRSAYCCTYEYIGVSYLVPGLY